MAVDMFLELDGIKGESQDDKFGSKGAIDVLAWSWGGSQSGTGHGGGGSGAGKVSVQDLSVTKYVDKSSATLFLMMCKGTHIVKGTLTVRKAGDKPLEYIKLGMEDLIVSSQSTGGSGGEDRLTENLTLNFSKFKLEYVPQKKDGTGEAAVECKWDIAANVSA
jgi:type VI secretion system secreted protein Hcp